MGLREIIFSACNRLTWNSSLVGKVDSPHVSSSAVGRWACVLGGLMIALALLGNALLVCTSQQPGQRTLRGFFYDGTPDEGPLAKKRTPDSKRSLSRFILRIGSRGGVHRGMVEFFSDSRGSVHQRVVKRNKGLMDRSGEIRKQLLWRQGGGPKRSRLRT